VRVAARVLLRPTTLHRGRRVAAAARRRLSRRRRASAHCSGAAAGGGRRCSVVRGAVRSAVRCGARAMYSRPTCLRREIGARRMGERVGTPHRWLVGRPMPAGAGARCRSCFWVRGLAVLIVFRGSAEQADFRALRARRQCAQRSGPAAPASAAAAAAAQYRGSGTPPPPPPFPPPPPASSAGRSPARGHALRRAFPPARPRALPSPSGVSAPAMAPVEGGVGSYRGGEGTKRHNKQRTRGEKGGAQAPAHPLPR